MTDVSGPVYSVTVLDQSGNEELLRPEDILILSFQYKDQERSADKCNLVVDNLDLRHLDNPIWKQGNRLRVSWGYPGRMAPTRICVIRKVTGFTQLRVEANGIEVVMNRVTRSRTFENMTTTEIIRQIARENGYGDDAVDIQDTTERREYVVQANLTDYQFIRRLGHQLNYEFFLDWDGLHFHERRLDQRSARTVTWYTEQVQPEVISIDIKSDLSGRPGRSRVRRRDPLNREDQDSAADNSSDGNRSTTGDKFFLPDAEVAQLTGQIFVAQEEQTTGGTASAEAAEAEARARFRRAQQQAVKMSLTMVGDPFILAKSIIRVEGIGQRLSGNYYVKDADHQIGENYRLQLSLIKDATGSYARRAARAEGLPEVAQARAQGSRSDEERAEGQSGGAAVGEKTSFIRPDAENATLTQQEFVTGVPEGEQRSRPVRRYGRDSRTRGGRPAPPASTEAAEQSTRG